MRTYHDVPTTGNVSFYVHTGFSKGDRTYVGNDEDGSRVEIVLRDAAQDVYGPELQEVVSITYIRPSRR